MRISSAHHTTCSLLAEINSVTIPTPKGQWLAGRTSLARVFFRTVCLLSFVAVGPGSAIASDDVPQWLRQAASASLPAYDKKVPAVVLCDEQRVRVEDDGRVTTVNQYAVKVLTREGRHSAIVHKEYSTDGEKVRDMRGWLLRPSGEVKKYAKDQVLDVAMGDDVYNEVRIRVIVAEDDAEVGAVFGYESIVETRQVFSQFEWFFQSDLPCALSRCVLSLPQGWKADSVTFNRAQVQPIIEGPAYTWELRDLPFIEEEPSSPGAGQLAARLAVTYFPALGSRAAIRTFKDWVDVSRWQSELADPQAAPNQALTDKARSLIAGASSELDKIRAIARFAQSVHYISIQSGTGHGGGYRPHSAVEVFGKLYGDCKDKANLMRSMLKTVGIESYPLAIYSGDPLHVRKEWPSPHQFNHCIIAIRVQDETQVPTVIKHATLGRLLIFDPTDEDTPVGDLPDHEQNSYALLVAGENGAIMRMPVTPPEANRLERQIEATLEPTGKITVGMKEKSYGQAAVGSRRMFHHMARPEFDKAIERWIVQGAAGAKLAKIEPADDRATGIFGLEIQFTSDNYAQVMQGKLMIFKPVLVSRRDRLVFTASSRKQPVLLRCTAYHELIKIKLPTGFEVDEIPEAVKLETAFGKYSVTYEVKDGVLTFSRSLQTTGTLLPLEQYAAVRGFFEKIRSVEQSPVVLAKK
jgi:hypothetical protein